MTVIAINRSIMFSLKVNSDVLFCEAEGRSMELGTWNVVQKVQKACLVDTINVRLVSYC